jgi:hypothetical protein
LLAVPVPSERQSLYPDVEIVQSLTTEEGIQKTKDQTRKILKALQKVRPEFTDEIARFASTPPENGRGGKTTRRIWR